MTMHLGNVDAGSTLYIPFGTYGKTNGESITLTGLAVTDIEVYKDGSATQRASDAGYALLDTDGIDFDGITGIHGFSIDLSDNTDAGFYAAGSFYWVVVSAVTVDGQTVNFIAATFRIGPAAVNVTQISGDATAADNLETMLDGTGGATLKLKQLDVANPDGSAIKAISSGGNGHGIEATGNGSGNGIQGAGGATGAGILGAGGATSGPGIAGFAIGDGYGFHIVGVNKHGLLTMSTGTGGDGWYSLGVGGGNGIAAEGGSGHEHQTNGTFGSDTGWTHDASWTIAGNAATHTPGTAVAITQAGAPVLTEAITYATVYTVTGRTTGSVTVKLKGASGSARSSNATFVELIAAGAGATDVEFLPSSDFDGAISAVQVIGPPGDGIYGWAPGNANYAGGGVGITAISRYGIGLVLSVIDAIATAACLIWPKAGNADGVRVRQAGTGKSVNLKDDGSGTIAGSITTASNVTTNNDKTGYGLSAASVQAIWDALTSALTTAGSIGKFFVDEVTNLVTRITTARAGYLDKLNISGNVAASSEVLAIQNNTRVRIIIPAAMERPDSGTLAYLLELYLYDEVGNMEAPDSTPTITARNHAGTDRSVNLGAVTAVGTGHYSVTYTLSSGDAIEQLTFEWTTVEGGATRLHGGSAMVVDTTAVDFTAADRAKLDALHDVRITVTRAANLDNLDATISSRATQASVNVIDDFLDTEIAAILAAVDTEVAQIMAKTDLLTFTGIDVKATLDGEQVTVADIVAAAIAKFFTTNSGSSYAAAVAGSLVKEIADNAGGGGGSGETQLRTGTAQAGGASTITLDAGAAGVDDYYKHAICVITAGTGAKQAQIIDSYVGATKIATMAAAWATAPDATSTFTLLPLGTIPGASAPTASTVATAVWAALQAVHKAAGSMGEQMNVARLAVAPKRKVIDKATGTLTNYDEDAVTPLYDEEVNQGATDDFVELTRA